MNVVLKRLLLVLFVIFTSGMVFADTKSMSELVYPDIPKKFKPLVIRYDILDGLTGDSLNNHERAKYIRNQLEMYAGYYQSPWYFLNFKDILGKNLLFKVRYFAHQKDFQHALIDLTHDSYFEHRNDFITVCEADGNIVLYIYDIPDSMRMNQLLKRQGFIQFASVALPTLPYLLRDGFSLYFEDIDVNRNKREIITGRTFLKNITHIPDLYTRKAYDEEYMLTDDQLYAWLIVNYMYGAYDHSMSTFSETSSRFQHFLTELHYDHNVDNFLEIVRNNNLLLVEHMQEFFNEEIKFSLEEHVANIRNHYQSYLAGLQAFSVNDLAVAKEYFIEAAFSLPEFYQPRYAIARISLYQIEEVEISRQKLQLMSSQANSKEKKEHQHQIKVLDTELEELKKVAHKYFIDAKTLIDHHLTYRNLSLTARQELEEFRDRILSFYDDDSILVSYDKKGEIK